jgi:hypothetical protein
MGFANTIRFMLADSQSIFIPLFSFNIGLEVGQALVVLIILTIATIMITFSGINKRWWTFIVSTIAGVAGLYLCIQRFSL